MVTCKLDPDIAGDLMGWKLPAWQALLVHRVLPSCGGLVIYITLMCFDIALVYEHLRDNSTGIASFSLILMVIPALLSLIFTLSSPRPGLRTDDDTIALDIEKSDVLWIFLQILNFLFFPFAAIGRYCHQIFWWIESVFAASLNETDRTREAIRRAREPSPMELYLFLQAFLHSAPHAVLNIIEMMSNTQQPVFERVSLQLISLVAASLRMASTATVYRRFEREKICGRQYPWNCDSDHLLENKINKIIEGKRSTSWKYQDSQPIIEENKVLYPQDSEEVWKKYDHFLEPSVDDDSEGLPIPPEDYGRKASAASSDTGYLKPISIIDSVAPRRRTSISNPRKSELQIETLNENETIPSDRSNIANYNIEHVNVTPPPESPAPMPGLISMWAAKLVENAETLPIRFLAPPRSKYPDEVIQDEPDIPIRVDRNYVRGLEPQDICAALVQYLGWYMFFVARLLSIAAFISSFPIVATIVLFSHYQIILLLLIVPPASTTRRGFYIFLAFIYLFCLMEFKVRFRHVRVWHVFWLIVSTIQTIVFTALWATIDNDLHSWWLQFIVFVIFGSLLLSYMCMLVYFAILKPKETLVLTNRQPHK